MTHPAAHAISPERLTALQTHWVRLAGHYAVEPIAAYPIFDRLVEAYSESHRHYHTLEHIAEMLKIVGRLAPRLRDPGLTFLAVWFHDVVYDPRATDNERQSAERAADWLGPFRLSAEQHERLRSLILATDHRFAPPSGDHAAKRDERTTPGDARADREANTDYETATHYESGRIAGAAGADQDTDGDRAILLDADLAILAAEERRYARYAAGIRAEFAHLSEAEYRVGRRRVLEALLRRPRLFRTPMMAAEGDAAARRNLTAEWATLTDAPNHCDPLGPIAPPGPIDPPGRSG